MKKTKKTLASLAIVGMIMSMIPINAFATGEMPTRLAGDTAAQTAVKIANQTGWTGTAILASSTSYGMVDALTAGPLASYLKAPILLTGAGDTLDPYTKAELTNLHVKKVYVTSGTYVIKQAVLNELTGMGIALVPLGGIDRSETSVNIAEQLVGVTKVAVANGLQDALSIAAVASAANEPILLTDKNGVPASVAAYLTANPGITASNVIGGTGIISDAVMAKFPGATRHQGYTAYDTNNQVIQDFNAALKYDNVFLANGVTGIDALAGAPLAAMTKSPIVLTDGTNIVAAPFVNGKLTASSVVTALGGTSVVPETTLAKLAFQAPVTRAVTKVSAINSTKVAFGTVLENIGLPAKVEATLSNGDTVNIPVQWNGGTPVYNATTEGTYAFTGTLVNLPTNVVNPNGVTVSTSVTVNAAPILNYTLDIAADKNALTADKHDNTIITVTAKDGSGKVLTNAEGVVKFTTTLGGLADSEVSLENGVATVELTSAQSDVVVLAYVTAQILSSNDPKLVAAAPARETVQFVPAGKAPQYIVTPIKVDAVQADRFSVVFSDNITAKDFWAEYQGQIKTRGNVILIDGKNAPIKAVKQKNAYTLELILNTDDVFKEGERDTHTVQIEQGWGGADNGYLRDNARHTLEFDDNIGADVPNAPVIVNDTYMSPIAFNFTDTAKLQLYNDIPDVVDGITVKAIFSEAVAEDIAENLNHNGINKQFTIDGHEIVVNANPTPQQVNAAKANNQLIATSIDVGQVAGGVVTDDTRNVVTIKLYWEFRLTEGDNLHTLAVLDVGDWAAMTDPNNMLDYGQHRYFSVTPDLKYPVPTLTQQSPEQWLLKFSKDVVVNDAAANFANAFELNVGDSFATQLQPGKDYILQRYVDEKGAVQNNSFLIEFTCDWTDYFDHWYDNNTKGATYHDVEQDYVNGDHQYTNHGVNYYTSTLNPFTLTINKDRVRDSLGNWTPQMTKTLTLGRDEVSPEIDAITPSQKLNNQSAWNPENSRYNASVRVKMNEPIQMRTPLLIPFNQNIGSLDDIPNVTSQPITPSVQQGIDTLYGVIDLINNQTIGDLLNQDVVRSQLLPIPTFEFENVNNPDLNVKGFVAENSVSMDDEFFTVVPGEAGLAGGAPHVKTLTPGTWRLHIRSISDDVGNTTDTVSPEFTVTAPAAVEPDANILWAAYSETGVDKDLLYVKFSEVMDSTSVQDTTNYVFNGANLAGAQIPGNATIKKGIPGITSEWDGITIELPDATWNGEAIADNGNLRYTCMLEVAYNLLNDSNDDTVGQPYKFELSDTAQQGNFDAVYENAALHNYEDGPVIKTTYKDTLAYNSNNDALVAGQDGRIDRIEVKLDNNLLGFNNWANLKKFFVNGIQWNINSATAGRTLVLVAPEFNDQVVGTGSVAIMVQDEDGNVIANGVQEYTDLAAPVLEGIEFINGTNTATLTFSEPINDSVSGGIEAQDFEYQWPNNAFANVSSVKTGAFVDDNKVVVTFNTNVGLQSGDELTVGIDNVTGYFLDLAGNSCVRGSSVTYKQPAK